MTYRVLDAKGIDYRVIDITEDQDAYSRVTALGYLQAPVVITASGEHWSGFRPDRIESI